MNWENLRNFECPHCGSPLKKPLDIDPEITCTECSFHIEKSRFKSILQHRGEPGKDIKRIRWQNLHQGKCPMCPGYIIQGQGAMLKCSNVECTFKIREKVLDQMLINPEHPINRFNEEQKKTAG